jgi:hypothetical protein
MQENRNSAFSDGNEFAPPEREDAKSQARVLSLVLSEWPKQLSKTEIARELLAAKPTWEERDALERATTDLASAGLLRECEVLLLPTRAALLFHGLELS